MLVALDDRVRVSQKIKHNMFSPNKKRSHHKQLWKIAGKMYFFFKLLNIWNFHTKTTTGKSYETFLKKDENLQNKFSKIKIPLKNHSIKNYIINNIHPQKYVHILCKEHKETNIFVCCYKPTLF